jgi:4-hydroxy-tetrahydrodipicolinate synthase
MKTVVPGTYTALVTPFTSSNTLDEDALKRLVEHQMEGGVDGIVALGTTAESPTISGDERERVFQIIRAGCDGPMIAGTGSNHTAHALEMTKVARELGADATLQVCPYYNKPNQEGLYQHFKAIAEEGGLPVMLYNVPGRTSKNIDAPTTLRLAREPGIVAVKEASGDLAQIMDLCDGAPDDFLVLSGDDAVTYPLMAMGGVGVVSVASNVAPAQMTSMVRAALEGDWDRARAEHYRLLPLFRALFFDTNPVPAKLILEAQGLARARYRLPLIPADEETRSRVLSVARDTGIL